MAWISPSAGRILLHGAELATVRTLRIGFVFQFFNLLPRPTALENIETALWLGGAKHTKQHKRSRTASAGTVWFGGQGPSPARHAFRRPTTACRHRACTRQRSRTSAHGRATGNLDSVTEAELLSQLGELHQAGKTLLMVTHNPAVAACAERVLHVKDGINAVRRRLCLLLLVCGMALNAQSQAQPIAAQPLTFKTLSGQTIRLSELRGKIVLINFWATSYYICLAEMPDLVQTYRQFQPHCLKSSRRDALRPARPHRSVHRPARSAVSGGLGRPGRQGGIGRSFGDFERLRRYLGEALR